MSTFKNTQQKGNTAWDMGPGVFSQVRETDYRRKGPRGVLETACQRKGSLGSKPPEFYVVIGGGQIESNLGFLRKGISKNENSLVNQ